MAAVFGLDFGETNTATRAVYGLVGLSGLMLAFDAVIRRSSAPRPSPVRV